MLDNLPVNRSIPDSAQRGSRRAPVASASWSTLVKTGVCGFLSLYAGGVNAQANPFGGATLVPDSGARGGPGPLLPPSTVPAPGFAPGLAPTSAPGPSAVPAPFESPAFSNPYLLESSPGTSHPRRSASRGHRGLVPADQIESYLASLPKHNASQVDASLRVDPPLAAGNRKLLTTQLISMPVVGCASADYSAAVTVGSQVFNAIIDTGSSTFGVASDHCTTCGVSPAYKLSANAQDLGAPVQADYGIGSWRGEEVTDVVQLGKGPSLSMTFGDITTQKAFFHPNNCVFGESQPSTNQAIMGMGPQALLLGDTQSYISGVMNSLRYPAFSLAACDSGGMFHLGGYPTERVDQPPFFTPFVGSTASPYVAVGMMQLNVGSTDVGARAADFGWTAIDTGTSGMVFPTAIYNTIVAAVSQASDGILDADFFAGGNCLALKAGATRASIDSTAPRLTFFFYNPNGSPFSLSTPATHAYLNFKYDANKAPYVCPLLIDAGKNPQTLLGNTMMRDSTVIFDLQKSLVGFAPSSINC